MRMNVTIASAAIALMTTACQTARMDVAPALVNVEPMAVEGANPRHWKQQIRFGPWSTTEARQGWQHNFAAPLLGLEVGYSFQPYRIAISSGDRVVHAECLTRKLLASYKGWSVDPSFGRIPLLACGVRDPQSGATGTIRLHHTATAGEEGELALDGERWNVRSVHRMEGSRFRSPDPVGYEIVDRQEVIAAIETINRGRVWIDPSLTRETKDRLAAVATALLLFERPDTD